MILCGTAMMIKVKAVINAKKVEGSIEVTEASQGENIIERIKDVDIERADAKEIKRKVQVPKTRIAFVKIYNKENKKRFPKEKDTISMVLKK